MNKIVLLQPNFLRHNNLIHVFIKLAKKFYLLMILKIVLLILL